MTEMTHGPTGGKDYRTETREPEGDPDRHGTSPGETDTPDIPQILTDCDYNGEERPGTRRGDGRAGDGTRWGDRTDTRLGPSGFFTARAKPELVVCLTTPGTSTQTGVVARGKRNSTKGLRRVQGDPDVG